MSGYFIERSSEVFKRSNSIHVASANEIRPPGGNPYPALFQSTAHDLAATTDIGKGRLCHTGNGPKGTLWLLCRTGKGCSLSPRRLRVFFRYGRRLLGKADSEVAIKDCHCMRQRFFLKSLSRFAFASAKAGSSLNAASYWSWASASRPVCSSATP